MKDSEAIATLLGVLESLEDPKAVTRVLGWANQWARDNHDAMDIPGPVAVQPQSSGGIQQPLTYGDEDELQDREIAGIALITDSGDFKLTVRNPKARNTNDAAIRLALVTIWAYMQLTGEKSVSSRKVVKPVLEDWRAYTGNTRQAISRHNGIIRNGDALSLDQHARMEAEQYVEEIRDDDIAVNWTPTARKRSKSNGESPSEVTVK
ncbi:hypothetical protein [Rhodopirellula halodulae]|uniref:hypothetical protein n=1 Tax=Rhodopirellula halodulae TaxID=2894198 RepID=UPI001E56B298|nr:hypothetical protein [Rhodopirellula sp. JC737]MCC9655299.1 hypothetical protein [Rhodopirellula sp. JC737]